MDFEGTISVGPGTSAWGPFTFDMTDMAPPGQTITDVIAGAFLDGEDTTAKLIDDTLLVGNEFRVYFNYPEPVEDPITHEITSYAGKHRLDFNLTLSSGGTQVYDFGYVHVRG